MLLDRTDITVWEELSKKVELCETMPLTVHLDSMSPHLARNSTPSSKKVSLRTNATVRNSPYPWPNETMPTCTLSCGAYKSLCCFRFSAITRGLAFKTFRTQKR